MNLRFDQPLWLAIALLAVPLLWIGWNALGAVDRVRASLILALRALLLLALAVMLAGPNTVQEHDDITVIGVIDISGSVRRFADLPPANTLNPAAPADASNIEFLRQWFRTAVKDKRPNDRFGLVVFDGAPAAVAAPTTGPYIDDNLDVPIAHGSNIASGLEMALAQRSADAAHRIVLATDGNQTAGDALAAVRGSLALSAAGPAARPTPVDVLPISYSSPHDARIERVDAPANAQPGQTVAVRITFQSSAPVTGRLWLRREDSPVDLNGPDEGASLPLALPAGQHVVVVNVQMGATPVNRLRADFEPDADSLDAVPENNRADAFVATPSKGQVLIVDDAQPASAEVLGDILSAADMPFSLIRPDEFPSDLLTLQNFDLVVFNDIPAHALGLEKYHLLARYVNDLGGGFIMLGGEHSFGPGGWNNTPVEALLPLQLDPPRNLVLPSAALVLVLDKSGSMRESVAGARATKQEIANQGAALAIQSLRADSLVGVITFESNAHALIPLQPNTDPDQLAAVVRSIQPEGGTNLGPPLELALEMLKDVRAARKRVVCLTDGRSEQRTLQPLVREMTAAGIQLTTIAVGDDADSQLLRELADIGNGSFTEVRNPRRLPQILVESVQVINEPLIKEGPFAPRVLPTGSTLTAQMHAAPLLHGIVLTSPRTDVNLRTSVDMVGSDGTPLLATGQAGLGKVAAFTSDLTGRWSRDWRQWPGYRPFVVQLLRSIARPASSPNAELIAQVRDEQLHISYETTGAAPLSPFLSVAGYVYDPLGNARPVSLQQSAPGRFEATLPAQSAGNYIIALNPRAPGLSLPPVLGGASKPTSLEFRAQHSNTLLLKEIADATGGRLLDVAAPASARLFERGWADPALAILPAWKSVLWLVLVLLLLDIACRRIAWSWASVRALASTLLRRLRPSPTPAPQTAAVTIASYQQVTARLQTQHSADARGLEKLQGSPALDIPLRPTRDELPTRPAAQHPSPRAAPDTAQVLAALHALRAGEPLVPPPPASPEPAAQPEPNPDADRPAQTTSSLLDAKRRIQDRLKRPGNP